MRYIFKWFTRLNYGRAETEKKLVGVVDGESEGAVPWLECWAAESRAVTLKAGPAVRSLWSTDRKEAWVTAAAKTGGRKEEMCAHTKVSERGHTTGECKRALVKTER